MKCSILLNLWRSTRTIWLRCRLIAVPLRSLTSHRLKKTREGAWVRKRLYKKKMVRRFLDLNPSMNYSQLCGTDCRRGIYQFDHNLDDDVYDSYPLYCLNRNNHIFLSVRGDLRIYHGALFSHGIFNYTMGGRNDIRKITNRRLRKLPFDAEGASNYAFCKKLCAPIPYNSHYTLV